MQRIAIIVAILAAVFGALIRFDLQLPSGSGDVQARADAVAHAFREQRSGIQVAGEGVVNALLSDDNQGSRHQRFVLQLASGQTVLVAHNIDLAPRIASLQKGDAVAFYGVYEWNAKGGVVHWTHHDPAGRHIPGWLRHRGQTYD